MALATKITVKKELYIPWDKQAGTPVLQCRYLGHGLRRREIMAYQTSSDWTNRQSIRFSDDNGRTWSEWETVCSEWPRQGNYQMETLEFAVAYDPVARHFMRIDFQRICHGDGADVMNNQRFKTNVKWDHNLWSISGDEELSWSQPRLLKYEPGDDFNPSLWNNQDYLLNNRMYGSYSLTALDNGTIIYPANMQCHIDDEQGDCDVSGIRCYIFKWNADKKDYDITLSEPFGVPHRISGRGLTEPALTQLKDGRLVMTMRGSTTLAPPYNHIKVESPGRAWQTVSRDGGRTWSPVKVWTFDNGKDFYAPGAFAKFIRHSSGRLFWTGNITPEPPNGDLPRYPLFIAEVDETTVTLKKATLTMIDNRQPDEPDRVQLSNFNIFENRESGVIELYLSRYGEIATDNRLAGNAWRYSITVQ